MTKKPLAGVSLDSGKNNITIFTIFTSILLITATVSGEPTDTPSSTTANAIVEQSCSATLHPDLCYATLSGGDMMAKVKTSKDVIDIAINRTKERIERNYFAIKKFMSRSDLTKRQKFAIHDCLEMVSSTLEGLHKAVELLETYPAKKGVRRYIDDIITLLSSTVTNQDTCIDGFSHDEHDRHVRESFIDGEINGRKMCSNSLALIKNMTDGDMVEQVKTVNTRRLMNEGGVKWPEWLSVGDRRLLQAGTVTPNVVVAADGSGDFTTISAAVAAAPSRSSTRYVIQIAAGVYRENVDIPSSKPNLMFVGAGRTTTIVTASRSVAGGTTTFNSATVAAVGDGFLARDLTFQNAAGPSGQQAVALRVGSDLSAFYRCGMIAYQDTLYVHSNRQFYINCYIAGTVDFIFGNAAAVLQDCDIHARRPNPNQRNMVTAQGRSDPNQNTGIVIQKSRIGATSDLLPVQASFPTYLGRPWRNFSRTVVMQSTISDVINPAGWYPWDGDFALATLYYGEYQNTGAGADTSNRVTWPGYRVITSATEAAGFTAGNFIDGGEWLGNTGFPFSLGL